MISKSWDDSGPDELGIPEGVFILGKLPQDWLFRYVSRVVHHGGVGTTAAGIALGKPTIVVRFFEDQPFWGAMIAKAKAGPAPIPYKKLTADKLAAGSLLVLSLVRSSEQGSLGAKIVSEKRTSVREHRAFMGNIWM